MSSMSFSHRSMAYVMFFYLSNISYSSEKNDSVRLYGQKHEVPNFKDTFMRWSLMPDSGYLIQI